MKQQEFFNISSDRLIELEIYLPNKMEKDNNEMQGKMGEEK